MTTIYRIHPGIGIARVGPSAQGYFIAGDTMTQGCYELDADGKEAPFIGYKDSSMLMRRQGVRFRVFQYERNDATGSETLAREITATDADIRWTVRLAATKASTNTKKSLVYNGQTALIQGDMRRNPTVSADSLRTEVTLQASGKNFRPPQGAETMGTIMGKPIYVGEARTDQEGRLVVLPGKGDALNWRDANGEEPLLVDFYDNPGWYDDIADGSVEAIVRLGGVDFPAERAWVVTAPPDFAPDTQAVTTLYDIALDAATPLPARITYPQDIEPFFARAAALAQTNDWLQAWFDFGDTLMQVDASDNTQQAALQRQDVVDAVHVGIGAMSNYSITKRQEEVLKRYLQGNFDKAVDTRPVLTLPEELDRAALDRCVGGGFLPGIEAGHTLRLPGVLSGTRLNTGQFTDWDGKQNSIEPGLLSGRMACPWQADFVECADAWWPAQRPDIAGRIGGQVGPNWAAKIVVGATATHPSRLNMVKHFGQLGVVTKAPDGTFSQIGRDPKLEQLP